MGRRATWPSFAVVELSNVALLALVVRRVQGNIPHPCQTSIAELYALLTWMRHLDPTYCDHVFYTDSQYVYDCFHNINDVFDCWVPYHDVWQVVMRCKSEHPSARVLKTKAQLSESAVEHCPRLLFERYGNSEADISANSYAHSLDHDAATHLRIERATNLVRTIGIYIGRVLDFGVKYQVMPAREILPAGGRIRRCTSHVVAMGPGGTHRCLRCFRLQHELASCQSVLCLVPGENCRRHVPLFVQDGVFCDRCGSYSFRRTVGLSGRCPGRPSGPAVARRLARLRLGNHPASGQFLGNPASFEEASGLYSVFAELLCLL